MTIEHNPDEPERQEALDEEVREDEAVWDRARSAFDEFAKEHKGEPSDEAAKALHKWLRHHGIDMHDDELATKAAKIAAGEAVELADVPSSPSVKDRPGT